MVYFAKSKIEIDFEQVTFFRFLVVIKGLEIKPLNCMSFPKDIKEVDLD